MAVFVVTSQLVLFVPSAAQAQVKNSPAKPSPNTPASVKKPAPAAPPSGQTNTTTPAAPAANSTDHLFNPIKYTVLADLIIGLTKIFTGAIIVVSVGFIVLGGSELVISAGNQEMIEKGRKTITWAIIGLIIALSAFSIVAIIEDLLGVK